MNSHFTKYKRRRTTPRQNILCCAFAFYKVQAAYHIAAKKKVGGWGEENVYLTVEALLLLPWSSGVWVLGILTISKAIEGWCLRLEAYSFLGAGGVHKIAGRAPAETWRTATYVSE